MGIAITLKEYLADAGAEYEVIQHPRTASTLQTSEAAHVPGDQMVKTVLLEDEENYLLALIPATHRLDIDTLNDLVERHLKMTTEDTVAKAFADCEVGAIPPMGQAYGIETLVDDRLLDLPEVFFETGDHGVLIHMSGARFRELLGETQSGRISHHM